MGVCVSVPGPALKTLRHDLENHIADGLGITGTPLGGQVNPPTTIVQPSSPYVTAVGYSVDRVSFTVAVLTKPGDPAAAVDALDDLVDQIRTTLKAASSAGYAYGFEEVSGLTTFAVGENQYPAVTVTVIYERNTP